jgi:hypothetical protein
MLKSGETPVPAKAERVDPPQVTAFDRLEAGGLTPFTRRDCFGPNHGPAVTRLRLADFAAAGNRLRLNAQPNAFLRTLNFEQLFPLDLER